MRGSFSSTQLVLAFGAACAGEPAIDDRDGLRVALLTLGPVSDQAWNGEAYRGLLAVRDSMGASISRIQTRTPASFDENFREYGRQSCDLVIGHGFENEGAAKLIVARTVRDRQPLPQLFALGAESGVGRFVINESLADRIGTEVRQRLDSAWEERESGAWRSPVSWTARDK